MRSAWVAGEALIDLVPDQSGNRRAIVGGGAANTARALAKLGKPTAFIGGISNDEYGNQINDELAKWNVDLSFTLKSELPTALAKVSLDETGSASYDFKLQGTATFDFRSEWLPQGEPSVLHVGTLSTLIEPGASELFEWANKLAAPKVFDPNVRSSVESSRDIYRAKVEKWISISDVLKLSEEDFLWLYPEYLAPSELLDFGAKLVVLTKGAKGMVGVHADGSVSVPGVSINLVDTVGAGDTVGAVLTESVMERGVEGVIKDLEKVLFRASKAAAIICSRRGADSPTAEELN